MGWIAESNVVAWAGVIVSMVSILLGGFTAVILAKVQRAQQLQDADRDAHAERVAALEAKLANADLRQHSLIEKLVDERFRAVSHEVRGHAQQAMSAIDQLTLAITEIRERLTDGDGQINMLAATDHQLELKIVGKFDQIKDWMRDTFAGKKDMEGHEMSVGRKFDHLEQTLSRVATDVAVFGDRVKK